MITFIGNLAQDIECKTSKNGNSYAVINVAQNQFKKETDQSGKVSYRQLDPVYWRLTVYGKTAERMAQSNIPKGTPLIISGRFIVTERPEFTTRSGEVVPARTEPDIIVENIGVALSEYNSKIVTVEGGALNKQTPQQKQTANPAPNKPTSSDAAFNNVGESDDLFSGSSDDLFGDSSDDDYSNLFE